MKNYDITFGNREDLNGLTFYNIAFRKEPSIADAEDILRSHVANANEYRSMFIALANQFPGKAWKSRFTLSGSFCGGRLFLAGIVLPTGLLTLYSPLEYWDKLNVPIRNGKDDE